MARNVFYRDFTLCKAVLLAGLIIVAGFAGEVPQSKAAAEPPEQLERVVPATLLKMLTECDETEKTGVEL